MEAFLQVVVGLVGGVWWPLALCLLPRFSFVSSSGRLSSGCLLSTRYLPHVLIVGWWSLRSREAFRVGSFSEMKQALRRNDSV